MESLFWHTGFGVTALIVLGVLGIGVDMWRRGQLAPGDHRPTGE